MSYLVASPEDRFSRDVAQFDYRSMKYRKQVISGICPFDRFNFLFGDFFVSFFLGKKKKKKKKNVCFRFQL